MSFFWQIFFWQFVDGFVKGGNLYGFMICCNIDICTERESIYCLNIAEHGIGLGIKIHMILLATLGGLNCKQWRRGHHLGKGIDQITPRFSHLCTACIGQPMSTKQFGWKN